MSIGELLAPWYGVAAPPSGNTVSVALPDNDFKKAMRNFRSKSRPERT